MCEAERRSVKRQQAVQVALCNTGADSAENVALVQNLKGSLPHVAQHIRKLSS